MKPRFSRRELAGSLGDLGTLLPLALGLILLNGLDATTIFITIGLFYILSGLYFRVTVPVQPMKVIAAYAIVGAVSPVQISTAGMCMSILLLVLAITGTMTLVRRLVPLPTIRGVQLVTGVLLFMQGLKFILGQTTLQQAQGSAEPFLSVSSIGPIPIGLLLGVVATILIFLLLENRYTPAALVVVVGGAITGLLLGGWYNLADFSLGLHLPSPLPFGWPGMEDLVIALTALALPQLPMTIGNAVIAQSDLTHKYFDEEEARRSTPRALAISMGLANLVTSLLGGMPLCHGAGGLAAHYRFGARTYGSNLMIGGAFLVVGLIVGDKAVAIFGLLPFSVLGALLCFAGAQLAMVILDVKQRKDLFVVVAILSISLITNLSVGFGIGIVLAYLLKHSKMNV
ncbi:MAG: sulfate permease [Deltaproteobacteria bacterium]|nr:sulfate permease [Deltaproteobacteria bacterium]